MMVMTFYCVTTKLLYVFVLICLFTCSFLSGLSLSTEKLWSFKLLWKNDIKITLPNDPF